MGLGGSWLEEQEGCPLVDRLESYLGESTHRTWQFLDVGMRKADSSKRCPRLLAGACAYTHPSAGAEGRTDCDYFFLLSLSLITSSSLNKKENKVFQEQVNKSSY